MVPCAKSHSIWLLVLLLPLPILSAQDCVDIQNYDFTYFTLDPNPGQSAPTNWSWAVGRSTGNTGKASQILAERGVTLQNPPGTSRFLQLHQFFDIVSDGENPQLYELEALDVVTTGDPSPANAYVKLASVDEATGTPEFSDKYRLILPAFPNTEHGSLLGYVFLEAGRQRVSFFYDGLGTMSFGSICAKRADVNIVDSLIKFINRHYSYFDVRGPSRVEFLSQTKTLQSSVTSGDLTTLEAAQQVLGSLTRTDPHVYLVTANGTVIPPPGVEVMELSQLWDSSVAVPYGRLKDPQTWEVAGRNALAMAGLIDIGQSGRLGVYFLLTSLAEADSIYNEIRQAVVQLLSQTDGYEIILDLRYNPGGDEVQGLKILQDILSAGSVNPVATKSIYYATNSFRIDPEDSSRFYEIKRSPVDVPAKSRTRMTVLTTRNCVSSCEGFVLALKEAGATLVGENTAGASGNPQPFTIPNVGEAFISTWKAGDANGVPFEVSGIAPDIEVSEFVDSEYDPVLDAAIRHMENTGANADSASVDSQCNLAAMFALACLVSLFI